MGDINRFIGYWSGRCEECNSSGEITQEPFSSTTTTTCIETAVSPQSLHDYYSSESFLTGTSVFDSSPSSLDSINQSPHNVTEVVQLPYQPRQMSCPDLTSVRRHRREKGGHISISGKGGSGGASTMCTSANRTETESLIDDIPSVFDGGQSNELSPPPSRAIDEISGVCNYHDSWRRTGESISAKPNISDRKWHRACSDTIGGDCAIRQAVLGGDGQALLRLHQQRPAPVWKDGQIHYPPRLSTTSHERRGASLWSRGDLFRPMARCAAKQKRQQSGESEGFSSEKHAGGNGAPFDALIIPSGGIELDGRPNAWTRERLDVASELRWAGTFLICLSRATPHKPVVFDDNSNPLDEAQCMSRYLVEVKGVDASRILCESWSRDTIGNAFACKQLLCGPMGLSRLLVINSLFHLPRTRILFDWIFHLPDSSSYQLHYLGVPNEGLSENQLKARSGREQESINLLVRDRIPRLRTMADLTGFVFREHNQYTSWRPPAPPAGPSVGTADRRERAGCSCEVRDERCEMLCSQQSEVFSSY
eukprot:GHVS01058482.1.p1 GENE.GHVS01058482.1~~GHVS01058482.1.p1  ORF type:complete len:536 (-),score=72.27 GHVS01058482.1:447-2054(-)